MKAARCVSPLDLTDRFTLLVLKPEYSGITRLIPWVSCQISKIAGCACAGKAGNVFPATTD